MVLHNANASSRLSATKTFANKESSGHFDLILLNNKVAAWVDEDSRAPDVANTDKLPCFKSSIACVTTDKSSTQTACICVPNTFSTACSQQDSTSRFCARLGT